MLAGTLRGREETMTTYAAVALIIATFFSSLCCFYYITKMANDIADQTVTGLVRASALPNEYRLIRFYQMFIGYALGAVVCSLFAALVFVGIARIGDSEVVSTLGNAGAAISVFAAAIWLLSGTSLIIYVRRLVKKATG